MRNFDHLIPAAKAATKEEQEREARIALEVAEQREISRQQMAAWAAMTSEERKAWGDRAREAWRNAPANCQN